MTNQTAITWMWLALFRLIITLTMGWWLLEAVQRKYLSLARILMSF